MTATKKVERPVVETDSMDVEVTAEALAEQMMIEQGMVKRDDGSWYKPKATRKDKLNLSSRSEKDRTKALLGDYCQSIKDSYDRVLGLLNGQVVRAGEKLSLAPLSDAQIDWFDVQLADVHASIIKQLRAGRRMSVSTTVVPD
jgi:hypothetical protein